MNSSMPVTPCYLPNGPMDWLTFFLDGVLTVLLVCFGLTGNILWSRRLFQQVKTSRWAKFLFMMCLWDSALLLSTLGFYSIAVLIMGHIPWNGIYIYFYIVFYPLINLTMAGSLWTILLISIERYVAVSHPLLMRRKQISVKMIGMVLFLAAVAVSAPTILELRIEYCWDDGNKEILPQIRQSSLRLDENYQLIYRVICYVIFLCPLPFIIILGLNIRIMLIRKAFFQPNSRTYGTIRRVLIRGQARDRAAALLTWMIVKFLICYTTPTLMNVLECLNHDIVNGALFNYFGHVNNLLVVIQSATNWLIYYQWNQKVSRTVSRKTAHHTETEIIMVENVWRNEDLHDMSQEILDAIVLTKPSLSKYFSKKISENGSASESSSSSKDDSRKDDPHNLTSKVDTAKVEQQVETIAAFIVQVSNLLNQQDTDNAKRLLRKVGQTHRDVGVKIKVTDWIELKKLLIGKLRSKSSVGENHSEEEKNGESVAKFVSFMIREMRNGYLCQDVVHSSFGKMTVPKLKCCNSYKL